MFWTSAGRGPWPTTPCEGQLDDVAGRLFRLALLDRPELLPAVSARFGVLAYAGRPPAPMPVVWELAGVRTHSGWQMVRQYLQRAARAGGGPPSLDPAIRTVNSVLPASAHRCALTLCEAGLTSGVLHPFAVQALAALWGRLTPGWRPGPAHNTGLIVGRGWESQRNGLLEFTQGVRRAGVISVESAQSLLTVGFPGHTSEGLIDLLHALGLHAPGSTVVWDRRAQGRLIRPVRRLLAATGPVEAEVVHAGLQRARHTRAGERPDPLSPGPGVIAGWAAEHPALELAGTTVGLAEGHGADGRFLTRIDRVIVNALRAHRTDMEVGELCRAVVAAGGCASANAAKTYVSAAPYLMSTGWGRVALASGYETPRPVGVAAFDAATTQSLARLPAELRPHVENLLEKLHQRGCTVTAPATRDRTYLNVRYGNDRCRIASLGTARAYLVFQQPDSFSMAQALGLSGIMRQSGTSTRASLHIEDALSVRSAMQLADALILDSRSRNPRSGS